MRSFVKGNFILSCGALVRRDVMLRLGGFSTRYRNSGEYRLWIELCQTGSIAYASESSAFYRRHDNNVSKMLKLSGLSYEMGCRLRACRLLGPRNTLGNVASVLGWLVRRVAYITVCKLGFKRV
jgi:hypothetical protein